ncbi:response regulator [Lignipirellula cremea]|uniref:Response regulatory domain-containing protein n=1 Tax=Lignipirellula cremea TaxID=2528010 RepID=A0A518DSK5_9BACT|nr:response regulator [Lignipirellula cremea]QDU94826.1 hypothetical protein Pla8534_26340 [Lignipirellula cremea]
MSSPARVLFLGDLEHPEFAACRSDLGSAAESMTLSLNNAEEVAVAEAQAKQWQPHLVVLAQARTGRFAQRQLEPIQAAAPNARWISLLGGWCEGEARSGEPYPGMVRVYWHQWRYRVRRELACLAGKGPSAWTLPRTATDVDRFLQLRETPLAGGQGLVVISAESPLTFETLTDPCLAAGYSTVWLAASSRMRQQGAAAALCDFSRADDRNFDQLAVTIAAADPAPVIALMNFPRRQDRRRALELGAVEVLSKPFLVDELAAALHAALGSTPSSVR